MLLRNSAIALVIAAQTPSLQTLKTTAESSDFKSTSSYDDVVKFMKAVDDASPIVFYSTYGTTHEGRAMPLAIVGTGLKDGSAASVKASGKLRVHIQGNVHAGEVEGKESAQILLREFALGRHADWLQSTIFLITPIFNADGNEKMSLTNRGRQNGPINGMGTRANAQGLNINRDFMKLDTPEGRAFVKLWADYDPHVGIDLHTSNGSNHAYHLTYSPPLHPNTSERIMTVMKNEWFPFVTKNVKAKHGWETFYYGNASNRGGQRAWATFEHGPRFHNNYVGLRNRFALLSEAYSYATFEDRIKATNYFLEEAMTFAHQNAARLKQIVAGADKEPLAGSALATRAQIRRGGMVEILMGEVEEEKTPTNGAIMSRRKDVVRPEQMIDMMWFEPTTKEAPPAEYYVPANAAKALDLLRAHGVQMRQTTEPIRSVQQFAIDSNTATQNFEGHNMRRLEGAWKPGGDVTVPAGAWVIAMNQPLARLAFTLLEPMSDDGLVNWNALDDLLADTKVYPILRK